MVPTMRVPTELNELPYCMSSIRYRVPTHRTACVSATAIERPRTRAVSKPSVLGVSRVSLIWGYKQDEAGQSRHLSSDHCSLITHLASPPALGSPVRAVPTESEKPMSSRRLVGRASSQAIGLGADVTPGDRLQISEEELNAAFEFFDVDGTVRCGRLLLLLRAPAQLQP